MRMVQESKKTRLRANENWKEDLGTHPASGEDVIEGSEGFGYPKWRKQGGACKFVIWKTVAGKRISRKTAEQLLTKGRTDVLDGFKSKNGKRFSAALKLERDGTRVKVGFDFG